MNTIHLRGVLCDVEESHKINNIEFSKAHLIVPRRDGKEDILNIRFKKFSNVYNEGEEITLVGNVRSYSSRLDSGKNKVELYVFTYFDQPDDMCTDDSYNVLELDGRICKIDELRYTRNKKKNIHMIIANNLLVSDGSKKLNSYVPCIAWGKLAEELANLSINTKINITGQLHSREYKKLVSDGNYESRVAHEVEILSYEIL